MDRTKPLPKYMAQRYHGWRATDYEENKSWYSRLEEEGQRPRAMVIACCDSRVNIVQMFGADAGEIFIHRNIANLVPPFAPTGDHHGTSAAVEYAVTYLKVSHLLVLGHSSCGGVQGCIEMCEGRNEALDTQSSFIGRWLDILRPGYERVAALNDVPNKQEALEKEAVVISLENLLSFPFVKKAVDDERLTLHGLWNSISEGRLYAYQPKSHVFESV